MELHVVDSGPSPDVAEEDTAEYHFSADVGTHVRCGGRVAIVSSGTGGARICEKCQMSGLDVECEGEVISMVLVRMRLAKIVSILLSIIASACSGGRPACDAAADAFVVDRKAPVDLRDAPPVDIEPDVASFDAVPSDARPGIEVVDLRAGEPSDECPTPPGWLASAGHCPANDGCAICFVSDPENREAGLGTPVAGCYLTFPTNGPRFFCVLACASCPPPLD